MRQRLPKSLWCAASLHDASSSPSTPASALAPTVSAQASRPTLLFLPGTLCDSRVWQDVALTLGRNGWSCVHIDYRDQHRIADMAEVALTSVIGQCIPIGLSMGGMVALEMIQRAPERVTALALFDTNADGDTIDRQARRDQQIAFATQQDMASLAKFVLAPSYDLQSDIQAEIVVAMAAAQSIDNFVAQSEALTHRPDMWPHLSNINVPTLIACGENDTVCPPAVHQRMASLIANAEYQTISKAGHLAPLDAPDLVNEMLLNWLEKNQLA